MGVEERPQTRIFVPSTPDGLGGCLPGWTASTAPGLGRGQRGDPACLPVEPTSFPRQRWRRRSPARESRSSGHWIVPTPVTVTNLSPAPCFPFRRRAFPESTHCGFPPDRGRRPLGTSTSTWNPHTTESRERPIVKWKLPSYILLELLRQRNRGFVPASLR